MTTSSAATVHVVDDGQPDGPAAATGSLVTPLLVLVAAAPDEPWRAEPHLAVTLVGADGAAHRIPVRELVVRSGGQGTDLVGLTLERPAPVPPDEVQDLDTVAADDPDRLATVALTHLASSRRPVPDLPGGDEPLSLWCRLFGMGCPRSTVVD